MKKSIKLENDFYWDANGIIYNKETLATFIQNYKNRVFLAYKGNANADDFNYFYTPGIYAIGKAMKNAPYTGAIYGVLVVLTNDGRTWQKTDTGSWLWQILLNTGGGIYLRIGINDTTPGNWKQIH